MEIWLKKEKKNESVSLSFWALSGFIYLVLATLNALKTNDVSAIRDAFLITSATYLGRRSPWFNKDDKLADLLTTEKKVENNEKDS